MGDIFILSDYGKISKHDEHLVYSDYEGKCLPILPFRTELIFLEKSVTLTADVFRLLSEWKIPVFIEGRGGRSDIFFDYENSKNVFLRRNQFRLLDNSQKSLEVAKILVKGKVKNQFTFALRIFRKNESDKEIRKSLLMMKEFYSKIDSCKDKDELRGIEGTIARFYFSILAKNIKPSWAIFESRSQHPPLSNVNSVLSFLYSLLTVKVQVAVEAFGLDSMVGNLHELTYGKNALAYDLVEEFRTPFVDTLCCRLFNNNMLREDDFRNENEAVYLTDDGRKKVICAFEEKINSVMMHKNLNKKMTYKKILFEQAKVYRDFIDEKIENYIPFTFK